MNDDADVTPSGPLAPGFEPARDALVSIFKDGLERGAQFAATLDGEVVFNLSAGWRDRQKSVPFDADTLTPVFSSTKAVTALVMAWLADRGVLAYEDRLATFWPEYDQAGKGATTLAQALSHQAGVPGFRGGWTGEDWLDWDKTIAKLAAMEPFWDPGTACGYHPLTFGFLAGEVARRADGRTLGTILREEICGPHDLDYFIGLPDSEHPRCAALTPPRAIPDFGEITDVKRAAFLSPWSTAGRGQKPEWRRAELPAANGHGTALAMARLMEPFARGGRLADARVLSEDAVAAAVAEQVSGDNLVLPYDMSFGCGLIRARPGKPVYGPSARAVGHTGFGGSFLFADPDRGLACAFAMTTQNPTLLIDLRMRRLIDGLYACV